MAEDPGGDGGGGVDWGGGHVDGTVVAVAAGVPALGAGGESVDAIHRAVLTRGRHGCGWGDQTSGPRKREVGHGRETTIKCRSMA